MRWTWMLLLGACGDDGLPTDSTAPPDPTDTSDEPTTDDPPTPTDTTDIPTEPIDPCTLPIELLEIATGAVEADYRPLAAGDEVTVFKGPQGGYHIDTGAKARTGVGQISFHPTVTVVADGVVVAGPSTPTAFVALNNFDAVTCEGTVFGQRALLLDYFPPTGGLAAYICSLEGAELDIAVEVAALGDQSVVAEGTVRVKASLDSTALVDCP